MRWPEQESSIVHLFPARAHASRARGRKAGIERLNDLSLSESSSPVPASPPQRPCRSCARPRLAGALQPKALRQGRRMALGTPGPSLRIDARGNSRAWRQSLFRPSERGVGVWRGWYASPPMTRRGPTWADPWPTGSPRSGRDSGRSTPQRTGPTARAIQPTSDPPVPGPTACAAGHLDALRWRSPPRFRRRSL